MSTDLAKLIPWLPALSAVLCGLCCLKKSLRRLAAWICTLSIAAGFLITLGIKDQVTPGTHIPLYLFDWIHVGAFAVNFGYYIDPLTIVMLCVVTGIGTLVSWYGGFYMSGDRGYARFFAAVSLFIFAMTTLVLADNLVLLYLGWEGVGLCSYLLIGYYYDKPSAVAAAKKAFIVNRIGDLGFALGIFLIYVTFGTVEYSKLFEMVGNPETRDSFSGAAVQMIPFLLMIGAFGKSAQLPLYMWLPDAMEGPTPVSALIHAATMVTAGVYMIARLAPLFVLSPAALPTVALVGGCTALFAATIALCQYDIKRVFAYSTISQLGYMFLGVGVLSATGAVFHLFTHAFFKALLFLTAGSVMHALTGQLDLRKMSGLRHKMPVTCWLMFIGCLALAGFPFLSGFYSKDMILAAAMEKGLEHGGAFLMLALMGLLTALLTAYYTFRLWFRVFMGPEKYEMGDEHHGAEDAHGHDQAHGHGHAEAKPQAATPGAGAGAGAGAAAIPTEHHHEPHEMPFLMNLPLMVLAAGAVGAGFLCEHWIGAMVGGSSAAVAQAVTAHHGDGHDTHGVSLLGTGDLHREMMIISSIIALIGIAIAAYFHWFNRPAADKVGQNNAWLVRLLANKYYVDEMCDQVIVQPLRVIGNVFFIIDTLIIDRIVLGVGYAMQLLGMSVRPTQSGNLQGYGVGMAIGATVAVALVVLLMK